MQSSVSDTAYETNARWSTHTAICYQCFSHIHTHKRKVSLIHWLAGSADYPICIGMYWLSPNGRCGRKVGSVHVRFRMPNFLFQQEISCLFPSHYWKHTQTRPGQMCMCIGKLGRIAASQTRWGLNVNNNDNVNVTVMTVITHINTAITTTLSKKKTTTLTLLFRGPQYLECKSLWISPPPQKNVL